MLKLEKKGNDVASPQEGLTKSARLAGQVCFVGQVLRKRRGGAWVGGVAASMWNSPQLT